MDGSRGIRIPFDFLFVLTQDLGSPSGLGRYLPLASALAKAGYRVKVIALHSNYQSLAEKKINLNGVQVHYVAQMHVLKQGSRKFYYGPARLLLILLTATFRLAQEALRSPARWIVVGKPHPMNGIAGLVVRGAGRSRLWVDCDDYEAGSGNFQNPWQRAIVAFFEKKLPVWADAVSTNTHFMRDNLAGWGVDPQKIEYLPNGIDEERFAREITEQELAPLRRELNLEGKQVIGYIGSLSLTNHSVLLLLDAFERLLPRVSNSVLLMVGGGEDYDRVIEEAHIRKIADRVIFCGRVAPEKVSLYYRLAHVSIDPVHDSSAARGRCPLKMFESWVCSVPFVSNDVGDRRKLAGEPEAALLAVPGDPDSLAGVIEQVLLNPELGNTLRARGCQRAPQFYWTRLAAALAARLAPERVAP